MHILEKIRLNRISVGGDGLEWVSMYFSQPEGTARVTLDPTTPSYIRIYRQKLPMLVKKRAKNGIFVTIASKPVVVPWNGFLCTLPNPGLLERRKSFSPPSIQ